ncbi:DUF1326 domain-containing protein [Candidatus Poribacteria bacterium]|nr:DUF1326 domain-containing protein [Candidatus Poribacteria bacterium]
MKRVTVTTTRTYNISRRISTMKRVVVTTTLTLFLLLAWAIGASLAATPWKLSGIYLESCNCDIPCPCLNGEMPTTGFCQDLSNFNIVHGFYGDVSLDGVKFTIMLDFLDTGDCISATYVDEKAEAKQVEAIQKIIQESFGSLITKDLGVKSVPINFEMSGDTYKWSIPGIYELESVLVRDMPSVPGFTAPILHIAKAVVQKFTDYDRNWDNAGKNSLQGRLLMPSEAPSDKVVGTIRVGIGPVGVDVNPYTRMAVVANTGDGTVSLIDLTTQKVTKTIPVGKGTTGPAINPYTNIAIVANMEDNTASIIDLASGTVKKHIPVGKTPVCFGMDVVRNIAVAANMGSNDVSVIDLTTEKVIKTIPVGAMPACMHWDVNPYTNQAIVANMGENTLSVIDLEKGVEIKRIPVGTAPVGASLNPYTNIAVVPNTGSNDVSVVDLTAGKVINTIPVGKAPGCSVIEPTMNLALISNSFGGDDTVSVIDLNAMSVVDTVTVGAGPSCLAIDEATMTALVNNESSNDMTIIDLKKLSTATEDYSRTFFLNLESGLNMISLPLRPITQRTARDLMNEVGATMAIKLDAKRSRFVGFTEADAGDGFAIEGGQGYIVNVKEGKVVPFVGAAWTNEPPVEAAPTLVSDSAWAFVLSGALSNTNAVGSGYRVSVTNQRTGVTVSDTISSDGTFAAVAADLSRKSVVELNDTLKVVVQDAQGKVVSGSYTFKVTPEAIEKAYLSVILPVNKVIPQKTALWQNYPNPFNPETWIPYSLSTSADVTLRIYDARGQLVRTFALGHRDAGEYLKPGKAAYWDGRNERGELVSSGVYFYTFQSGSFTASRKMVIIK